MPAVRADHDTDMLMFDIPPPLAVRGLEDYMAAWDRFYAWSERPVGFDFHDVQVTAGTDVAFATAIGRCRGVDSTGKREALEFRLTMGLRKTDGRWRIVHEHHSVTAT